MPEPAARNIPTLNNFSQAELSIGFDALMDSNEKYNKVSGIDLHGENDLPDAPDAMDYAKRAGKIIVEEGIDAAERGAKHSAGRALGPYAGPVAEVAMTANDIAHEIADQSDLLSKHSVNFIDSAAKVIGADRGLNDQFEWFKSNEGENSVSFEPEILQPPHHDFYNFALQLTSRMEDDQTKEGVFERLYDQAQTHADDSRAYATGIPYIMKTIDESTGRPEFLTLEDKIERIDALKQLEKLSVSEKLEALNDPEVLGSFTNLQNLTWLEKLQIIEFTDNLDNSALSDQVEKFDDLSFRERGPELTSLEKLEMLQIEAEKRGFFNPGGDGQLHYNERGNVTRDPAVVETERAASQSAAAEREAFEKLTPMEQTTQSVQLSREDALEQFRSDRADILEDPNALQSLKAYLSDPQAVEDIERKIGYTAVSAGSRLTVNVPTNNVPEERINELLEAVDLYRKTNGGESNDVFRDHDNPGSEGQTPMEQAVPVVELDYHQVYRQIREDRIEILNDANASPALKEILSDPGNMKLLYDALDNTIPSWSREELTVDIPETNTPSARMSEIFRAIDRHPDSDKYSELGIARETEWPQFKENLSEAHHHQNSVTKDNATRHYTQEDDYQYDIP